MPADPVLDPAALDRLVRIGGQDFLLEMIELFLENAPLRIAAARAALTDGDQAALYRAGHSLKSTAANLGARRLQALAERLELTASAGEGESVPPLLDALEASWGEARKRLEAERRQRRGDRAS